RAAGREHSAHPHAVAEPVEHHGFREAGIVVVDRGGPAKVTHAGARLHFRVEADQGEVLRVLKNRVGELADPIRAPSSAAIATMKSLFSSWSSRSRPTSAPSTTMSLVTDELSPSFSSSRVTRTCSASRMKALTPRAPTVCWSVRAKSRNVPA